MPSTRPSRSQQPADNSAIVLPEVLEITQTDIDLMEEAFGSPMCDIGTQNAVAIALSRALPGAASVRVCPHEILSADTEVEIGNSHFPLPHSLGFWLRRALHGLPVEPRNFFLRERTTPAVSEQTEDHRPREIPNKHIAVKIRDSQASRHFSGSALRITASPRHSSRLREM